MIEAKIVADSLSSAEARITTFVLTYPRFIHSEFMTHRMFSRNASSSRAIPVEKQIQMVVENPAIPLAFTKNQKGMQGGEALTGAEAIAAQLTWLAARDHAVEQAKVLVNLEVHKQYANRLLEPFSHITVICTATDFENFFALRLHPAAQPEICELAKQMYTEYKKSKPKRARDGYWHLPMLTEEDLKECAVEYGVECIADSWQASDLAIKRSVAKCARVSYHNHDGTKTKIVRDLALYNQLVGSHPMHASPAEHQAMAIPQGSVQSGNFRGWIQYRKTLPGENIFEFKEEE